MDLASVQRKLFDFIKKYRYVAIVLLVGVVFMSLPDMTKKEKDTGEESVAQVNAEPTVNEMLAAILTKVEGAGNVQVLLTVASGEETVYQTDDSISVSNDSNTTQIDTVTVTDAERNQSGLVRQINPPTYLGAIIVCQGAERPAVRLAIVDAVSKVTGLGADRISVLKMK